MAINSQFEGMQGKVLEAVAAFTQANERVVGQLIELSSSAARESLRTIGELQAAAVDTVRTIPMPGAMSAAAAGPASGPNSDVAQLR